MASSSSYLSAQLTASFTATTINVLHSRENLREINEPATMNLHQQQQEILKLLMQHFHQQFYQSVVLQQQQQQTSPSPFAIDHASQQISQLNQCQAAHNHLTADHAATGTPFDLADLHGSRAATTFVQQNNQINPQQGSSAMLANDLLAERLINHSKLNDSNSHQVNNTTNNQLFPPTSTLNNNLKPQQVNHSKRSSQYNKINNNHHVSTISANNQRTTNNNLAQCSRIQLQPNQATSIATTTITTTSTTSTSTSTPTTTTTTGQLLQSNNVNCNNLGNSSQRPTQATRNMTMAGSGPNFLPWTSVVAASRGKPRRGMMRRAVFSDNQRIGLEKRFQLQKYISKPDRKKLAERLGLLDSQVKIWFQNRRMKWRNSKERELLSTGGSREQTLPTRNNPNPDLSDVGETAKRLAAADVAASAPDTANTANTANNANSSSSSATGSQTNKPNNDDTIKQKTSKCQKIIENNGLKIIVSDDLILRNTNSSRSSSQQGSDIEGDDDEDEDDEDDHDELIGAGHDYDGQSDFDQNDEDICVVDEEDEDGQQHEKQEGHEIDDLCVVGNKKQHLIDTEANSDIQDGAEKAGRSIRFKSSFSVASMLSSRNVN